jgi:2-methylcitrate dehydratase PrpD
LITRKLAAFAAALKYEQLPAATTETAKRLLLDSIGCLIAGTAAAPGQSAARMAQCMGGNPQATVFADGTRNSVCHAAFVNGMTLYSVGLNDFLQSAGAHPGACVVPTVLAVGEWQRVPGTVLLTALTAGYEIIDRVGRSIMPSHRERGFHATGTCGTFGAAAAAGRTLGLDGDQIASAFGLAGSQAAGLYEYINDGTMTIMFHAGRAAQNGVEATLLAQAGITGPATVLEGTRGFFHATADVVDPNAALRGLGERFAVHATSFRPYFGCTSTIAASGATAQIMRRIGTQASAELEGIDVYCHPVVFKDNDETNPRTLLAARLSLPFNVALVLTRGDVLVGDLDERDLWNPRIRELIPLVRMISDEKIPRFGAAIVARFKGGSIEKTAMPKWRGDSNDPLPWDEVVNKFQRLVSPVINERTSQERISALVGKIETVTADELADAIRAALPTRPSPDTKGSPVPAGAQKQIT